ncbi:MAG: hypothetical protein LBL62_10745 [Planctomycetaceae bacterium]|jgi:hypothetical protein|nr:hypothetical protein [Planctomycetaceae bacterium]
MLLFKNPIPMYILEFISDSFGAKIDAFSESQHQELFAQALLIVKENFKGCLDIIEPCNYWLSNRGIYSPERVTDLQRKADIADKKYQNLEDEFGDETTESTFYFRKMCAFNGLWELYGMQTFSLRKSYDVIYDLAWSAPDIDEFSDLLEKRTLIALKY